MSEVSAIGIDLGTTFSCVGAFQGGRVEIFANDLGQRTIPSYVSFTDRECLVGEAAKIQEDINPSNTVFNVKRLIGRRFEDDAVQKDIKNWPFKVVKSSKKLLKIEVQQGAETRYFTAEQISSMVLSKMKDLAQVYLGGKIADAVIAVPAYFNVAQRQATINAGKLAGLNVLRLINEPTAAAIAFGINKKITGKLNVLVFDWGGGTFDVSILSIENRKFEVKAVGGDTHLGGEDITSLLVDHFVEIFKRDNYGKDLTTSKKAVIRLRKHCEEAKRILSLAENAYIEIVSLFDGIDFSYNLTRSTFERLCSHLFKRTMDAVKAVLRDAEMVKADINEILLVGGSTRIPKVGCMIRDFFEGKEVKKSINAEEAIAYGAAIMAANLAGEDDTVRNLTLLEVTPLSLGLHDCWGAMTTVVKRNTPIPTKQTKAYRTTVDNQSEAVISIFEGERANARDNNPLGEFILSGFPPGQRGKIKVDVTFEVNVNGILHVSAVERLAGKNNSLMITNYGCRSSDKGVEKMLKNAENFKQADEKERSKMLAMKRLVNYVCRIQSGINEVKRQQKELEECHENILAKCVETIEWINTHKEATTNDYEQMQKELETQWRLTKEATSNKTIITSAATAHTK